MAELAIDFTSDELIKEIKTRQTVPTSQGTFDEDGFVRLLNGAMLSKLVPAIASVKEEYFVTFKDVAIVAGTAAYNIPPRALGGKLRDVLFVDANGKESELTRLSPESEKNDGSGYGAVLRGHQVILKPTPTSSSGSVRFYFERRPNNLCKRSAAGLVTGLSGSPASITVAQKPSTWTIGTKLDFISPDPMFEIIDEGVRITSINVNTLFLDHLPTLAAGGQYVALAGFSPIPQLPYEAHLVMAQYAAAAAMASLSNKSPMAEAMKEADRLLADFIKTINPRIDGETKKFAGTGGGIFSAGSSGWSLNVGP